MTSAASPASQVSVAKGEDRGTLERERAGLLIRPRDASRDTAPDRKTGASMTHTREDLTFTSGGDQIAAWLYRPSASEPVPCVVMAHGFSGTRRDRLPAYAER